MKKLLVLLTIFSTFGIMASANPVNGHSKFSTVLPAFIKELGMDYIEENSFCLTDCKFRVIKYGKKGEPMWLEGGAMFDGDSPDAVIVGIIGDDKKKAIYDKVMKGKSINLPGVVEYNDSYYYISTERLR